MRNILVLAALAAASLFVALEPAHAAPAPAEHVPTNTAPAPPTATPAAPNPLDQARSLAMYWRARYLVLKKQLSAVEDEASSCPTYLEKAIQEDQPQQSAPAAPRG